MAGPEHRLRLVTMNVQLMTQDALLNRDAVENRAIRVAEAFLADRWADVICFNEVFDEGARTRLKDRLVDGWPYVAEKFGPVRTLDVGEQHELAHTLIHTLPVGHALRLIALEDAVDALLALIPIPDDAGLMVFSRYPIEASAFVSYNAHTASDSLADKGAALVQIRRSPQCVYNVIASHLQAAYATLTEHQEIRARQLGQIRGLIETRALPDFATPIRAATVVCGDLNIQGAPQGDALARPEWTDVFMNGTAEPFFRTRMVDAWDHYISSGFVPGNDRGITNRDRKNDWENRLDYVLLLDPATAPIEEQDTRKPFAVQRMFLVHPGLSDHIGVAAEINLDGPHRSPLTALDAGSQVAGGYTHVLTDAGMYWLRFRGRGTWSFTSDANTGFTVHLPQAMSEVLRPQFFTDLTQDPYAQPALEPRGHADMRTRGSVFTIPVEEFYIRVYRRADDAGAVAIGYVRHLGTSPYLPITLAPQAEHIGPDWGALATAIVNQPLEFWFWSRVRAAVSGAAHTSEFEMENPSGEPLEISLLYRPNPGNAQGEEVWAQTNSADARITLSTHRPEGRAILWRVRRQSTTHTDFAAHWRSALNYLVHAAGNPPTLLCVEETGVDAFGDDEISLQVRPDDYNGPVRMIENREGVSEDVTLTVAVAPDANWRTDETGFVSHLEVRVIEHETLDDDVSLASIPPLAPHEASAARRVTLTPGAGEYRLDCRIAREP